MQSILHRPDHASTSSDGRALAVQGPHQEAVDLLEAQRQQFARELHDEFGQRLALLKFHCHRLRQFLDHDGATTWCAAEAEIDALIAHVRAHSGSLYPPELQSLGLAGALQKLLDRQLSHSNTGYRFEHADVPARLPAAVELALYRVTQESLTNIVRYAGATQVHVRLGHAPGRGGVRLTIADDGIGRVRAALAGNGAGSGQAGMCLRLEQVGGTLELLDPAVGGTVVVATVPLHGRGQ